MKKKSQVRAPRTVSTIAGGERKRGFFRETKGGSERRQGGKLGKPGVVGARRQYNSNSLGVATRRDNRVGAQSVY